MKKISTILLTLLLLCTMTTTAFAAVAEPDSISYNGILPDGTSVTTEPILPSNNDNEVMPRVLIGYEYVAGYEELKNEYLIEEYKRIWGTSITFIAGTLPSYEVTETKQVTSSNEWYITASVGGDFALATAKANLQAEGGYSSSATATLSRGEKWTVTYETPGTYYLNWYQRAYQYDAYCGANIISTDINDGTFTKLYLGSVVFPTDERHFSINNTP